MYSKPYTVIITLKKKNQHCMYSFSTSDNQITGNCNSDTGDKAEVLIQQARQFTSKRDGVLF